MNTTANHSTHATTAQQLDVLLHMLQGHSDAGKHLTEAERVEAVSTADRVMIEQQPEDVAGANHKELNAFGRARLQAREVAGHIARLDGATTNNPFKDESLRAIYKAERRWMAYLEERAATVTLQQLVDLRADLISDVHGAATSMHLAQRREADMYWSVGQDSTADEAYGAAAAFSQESVSIFRVAAGELRRFLKDPTRQEAVLGEFRELERLESRVAETKASAVEINSTGLEAFADDAAQDVSSSQDELACFLRDKGVTVPAPPRSVTAKVAENADDCDCTDPKVQARVRAR